MHWAIADIVELLGMTDYTNGRCPDSLEPTYRTYELKLVIWHLQVLGRSRGLVERYPLATRGMPNARVPLPMEYSLGQR